MKYVISQAAMKMMIPLEKKFQLGPAKRKLEIGGNVSFEEPSRLPSACGELRIC